MKRFLPLALLVVLAAFAQHGDFPKTKRLTVPKHYGRFVAVYADQLLFEDADGTLRSVYPNGGAVVFQIERR